jgi:hypothetical protein
MSICTVPDEQIAALDVAEVTHTIQKGVKATVTSWRNGSAGQPPDPGGL